MAVGHVRHAPAHGQTTLATTGTLTGTVRDPEDPESQALPAELSAAWSSELVFAVGS